MPFLLGDAYSPEFRGRPPSMPPGDYALWLTWWPTVRHLARRLYFNVNLGEGRRVPVNVDAALFSMWYKLTTKRADLIVHAGSEIWLVELHDPAGPTSLGRLLIYRELYLADPPFPEPLRTIMVTSAEDPDVTNIAEQMRVEVVVVPTSRYTTRPA